MRVALVLAIAACGDVQSLAPEADVVDAHDADAHDAAIDAPAGALTLSLEHASLTLPGSIGVEVDVALTRTDVPGDVEISVASTLPSGLTAPAYVVCSNSGNRAIRACAYSGASTYCGMAGSNGCAVCMSSGLGSGGTAVCNYSGYCEFL